MSQRTHISRGARRAEKRNLLLPKGKTVLLKVAESLKSISKASSGLYVLNQVTKQRDLLPKASPLRVPRVQARHQRPSVRSEIPTLLPGVPDPAMRRKDLRPRPSRLSLVTGRHSSGGNEDGHGRGEVGGRRSLARVRRAAGQVRRELDPSIVVTRRGHLQYERAILDW